MHARKISKINMSELIRLRPDWYEGSSENA